MPASTTPAPRVVIVRAMPPDDRPPDLTTAVTALARLSAAAAAHLEELVTLAGQLAAHGDGGARHAAESALESIRAEIADRDEELRAVLARLGELYNKLAEALGAASLLSAHRVVAAVETLTSVGQATAQRLSDVGAVVERLASATHDLTRRVDVLVDRVGRVEERLGGPPAAPTLRPVEVVLEAIPVAAEAG